MLLMTVLYIGAIVTFWLGLYALLRYRFPNSLLGRVSTVLV